MRLRELRGRFAWVVALGATLTAALACSSPPAEAAPAAPALEFLAPSFPVPFTAEGGEVTAALAGFDTVVHCDGSQGSGELTGPRTALSTYVFTGCETQGGSKGGHECKSAGAEAEEIRSGQIEAELVFIEQFFRRAGMLLAPHGGVYLSFECGGEAVQAIGPFLSPVSPTDQMSSAFTATLGRSGALQTPNRYEGPDGEALEAIPTGVRGGQPAATTGVELGFTIHTAVPIEVKARSTQEVELIRFLDEQASALTAKHLQEVAAQEAAAREMIVREAATKEAAERQRLQELISQGVKKEHEAREATRARQLSKALRQCKKVKPGQKRARCESRAKKKFAPQGARGPAARI